ncbi:alpha-tocopherol transfer protein-like [Rhodnius prolixus]|uniref:alpha-tocopherol transfer protein-like n=1 Tax=Rhodnius prolixus TaxID=13249 RepID=UPI003D187E88
MTAATNEKWWKITKEEEYKNNKKLKPIDVSFIKEWIRKQPHLPQLNDNQIIMFLRACDYSLERTKETIDLNYTTRTKLPDFFSERDLERKAIKIGMEYLHIAVSPKREDDSIVISAGIKPLEISKLFTEEYLKLALMIHDMTHLEYGSAEGYIYILDFKNVTFTLVLHLPLPVIVNALKFWQYCATYKIKGIHIINGGTVFEKALPIFQPFLKSEIVAMIKVHSNYESLRDAVSPKTLPSDYGGSCASVEELTREAYKNTALYKEWFFEEEKQRVEERKRLSNAPKDYGIQGSFRKLELD